MTQPKPFVVLITGANRGLGLGLSKIYLARPNVTLIAALRDPSHPAADLDSLPVAEGSKLVKVRIESKDLESPKKAMEQLKNDHGIEYIDVVIANAGISQKLPLIADVKVEDSIEHYAVNVVGPIYLFQATKPLLLRSSNPRFIAMSSGAGSIKLIEIAGARNGVYAPSKAALNWIARKIHFEEPEIVSIPMDPGWVQTEMGNWGAREFGLKQAPTTVEDSCNGMVDIIDKATKTNMSGEYMIWTGERQMW